MLPSFLFARPSPRRAAIELLLSSFIWGFSFAATRWALSGMGPFSVAAARFVVGALFTIPLTFHPKLRWTWREASLAPQLRLALLPGLLMSATLVMQTLGLESINVGRGGFITSLYVVFVPLFERAILRRRLSPIHWLWVLTALTGTMLICHLHPNDLRQSDLGRGDLWMLGSAVMASLQILSLEIIARRTESALAFNAYQILCAALLPLAMLVVSGERLVLPLPPLCIWGVLFLAIPATAIALMVQVRSQRELPPSIAAMLFLLESPLAALFAYLCFGESLDRIQWLGALLILGAAAGTLRFSSASHAYSACS